MGCEDICSWLELCDEEVIWWEARWRLEDWGEWDEGCVAVDWALVEDPLRDEVGVRATGSPGT